MMTTARIVVGARVAGVSVARELPWLSLRDCSRRMAWVCSGCDCPRCGVETWFEQCRDLVRFLSVHAVRKD